MNNQIVRWLMIYCEIVVLAIGMVTVMNCFVMTKRSFCESKKEIIMKEEVRAYLISWIKENVIEVSDLEAKFERYGSPGHYLLIKKIDFDWKLLGMDEFGEIDLFGKNLDSVEAVYFGEGFRRGILVSLREDKQFPPKWFNKNTICYQFEEFAVFYDDGTYD